jgi:hypothetical protein
MKSRRIAILIPAIAVLATAPATTALAATHSHASTPTVSRSDLRDVSERAGNPDRSSSDNGRADSGSSSGDSTSSGHDSSLD